MKKMEEEVMDKYKVEDGKRESPSDEEVPPSNKEKCVKQNIKTRKCGEDYFFLVQRIQFAAFAKQTGGVKRRRGDEAAGKNDYYERSEKEK